MKARIVLLVLAVCLVVVGVSKAEGQPSSIHVGPKLWVLSSSYQWPGDKKDTGDGIMYGGLASVDLPAQWWVSVLYLQGSCDYAKYGDLQYSSDEIDGELIVGRSFRYCDLGLGARYIQNSTSYPDDPDLFGEKYEGYGPSVYAGFANNFGNSPFGWYACGTWMFLNMDSHESWLKYEHFNVEAGLSLTYGKFQGVIGYRYKLLYAQADSLEYHGPAAAVICSF